MAPARGRGECIAETYKVARTRITIALSVIATINNVVSIASNACFIGAPFASAAGKAYRIHLDIGTQPEGSSASSLEAGPTPPRERRSRKHRTLSQPGPVVSHQDGIARIRRVVLHTGLLSGYQPFKSHLAFQARHVLRCVIRDTGDRITVENQMPRLQVHHRTRARLQQSSFLLHACRRLFHQVYNLAFRDSPDMIQMQPPLALRFLRVTRWTYKRINKQGNRSNGPTTQSQK